MVVFNNDNMQFSLRFILSKIKKNKLNDKDSEEEIINKIKKLLPDFNLFLDNNMETLLKEVSTYGTLTENLPALNINEISFINFLKHFISYLTRLKCALLNLELEKKLLYIDEIKKIIEEIEKSASDCCSYT